MAKAYAADMAMRVTTAPSKSWGRLWLHARVPCGKVDARCKILQIVEGTSQIQRVVISQCLRWE